MGSRLDSTEAIQAVDGVLAGVGLVQRRRQTRAGARQDDVRQVMGRAGSAPVGSWPTAQPGLLTLPAWSRWPWLRAGFSTRVGGRTSVYGAPGDQNLGWTKEDDPQTVAGNRQRFLDAVQSVAHGRSELPLLTVRQVHSGMIRTFALESGRSGVDLVGGVTPERKPVLRGDALITATPGVLLGIITADCVPVLVADTRTHAVAAFHAGWRGTLARIVERGVGTMRMQFGSRPQDLVAAIGPAIGPCCFAVGDEVRFEFESQFTYAPQLFSEVYDSDPVREKYPLLFLTARAPGHSNIGPQIHLDLIEANRRQLLDAGVPASGISVVPECTACTRRKNGRRKYFSHRAEAGFTGRMLSVIGAAE